MLYDIIDLIFNALYLALMIRVLMSWLPNIPDHPVVRIIYEVTDPILNPFRQMIPSTAGIDFSPILAFLALEVARQIVLGLLF